MTGFTKVALILLLGLLVAVVAAGQAPMDRKTLAGLLIKPEEVREVLGPDWKLKTPAEPLPREPEDALTSAAIFENLRSDLILAILYWFETEELAKNFYALPIAVDAEGESAEEPKDLKDSTIELAVEKVGEADEARIVKDTNEDQKVLQFRKGQFISRFRVKPSDFPNGGSSEVKGLIDLAQKQLEILIKGRS